MVDMKHHYIKFEHVTFKQEHNEELKGWLGIEAFNKFS